MNTPHSDGREEDARQSTLPEILAGAPPIPMPAKVAARLHDAIGAEQQKRSAAPSVSSGSQPPRHHRVDPRRRRRRDLLAGAALTLVVLVVAGVWIFAQFTNDSSDPSSQRADRASVTPSPSLEASDMAAAQRPAEAAPDAAGTGPGFPVLASGTDYRLDERLPSQVFTAIDTAPVSLADVAAAQPALAPLTDLSRLSACVAEVAPGGGVIAADFARYLGEPALLIAADDPTNSSNTILAAVGPNCNTGNADERARISVPL